MSLSHLAVDGSAAMVDVSTKPTTIRRAIAEGRIRMRPDAFIAVRDAQIAKGDVLGVARVAGVMAAKRTADLIPLCHPIALTRVTVDFTVDEASATVHCRAQAECDGRTGVEMEALTAVQVGLLTIYDMVKAIDRGMVITDVRLLEKHGGKSGSFVAGQ